MKWVPHWIPQSSCFSRPGVFLCSEVCPESVCCDWAPSSSSMCSKINCFALTFSICKDMLDVYKKQISQQKNKLKIQFKDIILYDLHPIEVEGLLLVRSWLPSFRPTPIETIEVQILWHVLRASPSFALISGDFRCSLFFDLKTCSKNMQGHATSYPQQGELILSIQILSLETFFRKDMKQQTTQNEHRMSRGQFAIASSMFHNDSS